MLRNTDSQVECHISFRRGVLKKNSEPRFSFYYSICRSYPYRKYCNDEKKKWNTLMLKPSKAKRRTDIETISSFPGLYIEKHFFNERCYLHIIRHRRGRYQRNQDVPDDKKRTRKLPNKKRKTQRHK